MTQTPPGPTGHLNGTKIMPWGSKLAPRSDTFASLAITGP
jgi:hypothetical protein